MPSENTKRLNAERNALRAAHARDVSIDRSPGPNRAQRRLAVSKFTRRKSREEAEREKLRNARTKSLAAEKARQSARMETEVAAKKRRPLLERVGLKKSASPKRVEQRGTGRGA